MQKSVHTIVIAVLVAALVALPGQTLAQTEGQIAPSTSAASAATAIGIDFGGVYLLQLARQKSVQADLGIDSSQKQNLDALQRRLQKQATEVLQRGPQSFRAGDGISTSRGLVPENGTVQKDATDALTAVLSDSQTARLKQIALQQQGPQFLLKPAIAAKLQLTESQSKKIGRLTPLDSSKIARILTAEQQAKWQEMVGRQFRGQLTTFASPMGP